MKRLMALTCMTLLFAVSGAAMAGAQQEKMKVCSKEAKEKGLKKAERKAFMKECLSNKAESAAGEAGGKKAGK